MSHKRIQSRKREYSAPFDNTVESMVQRCLSKIEIDEEGFIKNISEENVSITFTDEIDNSTGRNNGLSSESHIIVLDTKHLPRHRAWLEKVKKVPVAKKRKQKQH